MEGWRLTAQLWSLDLGKKDNPTEPDINGYEEFYNFGRDNLVLDTRPDTYLVRPYRGKQFIPFENTRILMGMASMYFEDGRAMVLPLLP